MASLDMLQVRSLLKRGVVGQVGDDLPVLLTMKYIGGGSVTSVTVTTATDITTVSVEAGVTSTKEYTWADYVTVGALVDAINADGLFAAKVMDALTSTPTGADLAIAGALTADADGNFNVLSDTSNADFLAYRLTYDRSFGVNQYIRNGHRVSIMEIITDVTCGGGADANSFKIYEAGPANRAEKVIYQKTPTTGSISTTNWASGNGKISGSEGSDLIVYINDATSITGTITVVGEAE